MPKLWLAYDEDADYYFLAQREPSDLCAKVQLEVNNSLFRQIQAAETRYEKFQAAMEHWMNEAEAGKLKRVSDGR
jgi:hypothetical protein